MAVVNWFPRAAARSQVDTLTAGGTWVVGDVVNVIINGKTVSFTATTTTAASMITGLLAALQASTITEFSAITWTSPTSTTIAGTGSAGVPFTATVSRTTAGTGTFTTSTGTTATGPENWSDVNNWDGGAIPANSDEVNIDLSLGSIKYGLDQSSVTPASLYIYARTQTQNTIGLPRTNASGYVEYRTRELTIKPASCTIDCNSPRINLNFSSGQVACEVVSTGSSTTNGIPAVTLRGTNASNTWEIVSGSVGLAVYDGEQALGASLKVGADATVFGGKGCSIDAITTRGNLDYSGVYDTLVANENTAIIRGSAGATSVTAEGGTVEYRSTGTVDDVYLGGNAAGMIDCSKDLSGRTFTTVTLKAGGRLNDPGHTVTITNGIALDSSVSSVSA